MIITGFLMGAGLQTDPGFPDLLIFYLICSSSSL